MTREEIRAHIDKLPQDLIEKYGIKNADDISTERCEVVNGYNYYPDIHSILIGSRLVTWEIDHSDTVTVDPYNSVHFVELERRGLQLQDSDTVGVILLRTDGKFSPFLSNEKDWPSGRFKRSSEYQCFPFDGTKIYYHPDCNDVITKPEYKLLAECLFLLRRYEGEYIVPYKGDPYRDWM